MVLRLVVLAIGWAALLLSAPTPVYRYAPVVVVFTGVLAATAAVLPRRHTALVLELGVVGLWLLPGGHAGSTGLASVVLAALLYLHHATAALAAATGWNVRTTGSLARRWSRRTAGIVAAASVTSSAMLLLSRGRGAVLPDGWLLVGLAAAVGAAALPLHRLRSARRSSEAGHRTLEENTSADD